MRNKYLQLNQEEKQKLIEVIMEMKAEKHTMKEISSHTGLHGATIKKIYLEELEE